jgi:hypothetical protein
MPMIKSAIPVTMRMERTWIVLLASKSARMRAPNYSCRRAIIGSTRMARRAGM